VDDRLANTYSTEADGGSRECQCRFSLQLVSQQHGIAGQDDSGREISVYWYKDLSASGSYRVDQRRTDFTKQNLPGSPEKSDGWGELRNADDIRALQDWNWRYTISMERSRYVSGWNVLSRREIPDANHPCTSFFVCGPLLQLSQRNGYLYHRWPVSPELQQTTPARSSSGRLHGYFRGEKKYPLAGRQTSHAGLGGSTR